MRWRLDNGRIRGHPWGHHAHTEETGTPVYHDEDSDCCNHLKRYGRYQDFDRDAMVVGRGSDHHRDEDHHRHPPNVWLRDEGHAHLAIADHDRMLCTECGETLKI